MLCFYHRDVEAVGICKSCGRAICHECCAEIGHSIGCRNRCETEVQQIDDLRRRSTTMNKLTGSLYSGMGVFFLLAGVPVFAMGLFSFWTKEPVPLIALFGLLCIAAGIACFVFARRTRR